MFSLNLVRKAPGVRSAMAVAVVGMLCSGHALAQERTQTLEPVVVTATRGASLVSPVVADVSVIDAGRLRQATGQSLMSLLAEEAGLQFASNGGLGKSGSVYIRGGESRHTLLLIDGVRYGSVTLGQPILENIPLDQIERIEIVRGPMSSLYGSDAASGVIQIFTKRGKSGWAPTASVGLGTDDLAQMSVGLSGGQAGFTYSGAVQILSTNGFSASNPRALWGNYHPDRDSFRQRSLALSGAYALNKDWKVDAHLLKSYGTSAFDDGVLPDDPVRSAQSDAETSVVGAGVSGRFSADWRTTLKFAESVDVNDTTEATQSWNLGAFRTRQTQLSWDHHIDTPLGEVLVVAERLRQEVAASGFVYDVSERTIDGLALGLFGDHGPHVWQLSARHDRNSQFGGQDTGSAAYGFHVSPEWRLGVSVGSSFVAPSFNQLYYPGYGLADLLPERGLNKELSVGWNSGEGHARLALFKNRIRSFIQSGVVLSNVPWAEMAGLSFSASQSWDTTWGRLGVQGAYDWLDATNESTGKELALRARQSLTLRANLSRDSVSYGVYVRGHEGTYSDAENTTAGRLAGYGLWGLSTQVRLSKAWVLGARVDNVANRWVETQRGYNQPGRQCFVSLTYAPVR